MGPLEIGSCGRFEVMKTGDSVGKLVYRNAQGEGKIYRLKISGEQQNSLEVLRSMAKKLNAKLADLKQRLDQALAIGQKNIQKVGESLGKDSKAVEEVVATVIEKAPSNSDSKSLLKEDLKRLDNLLDVERDLPIEFYRICASQVSYEKWVPKEEIGYNGYRVDEVFKNERGLTVVVLVSDQQGSPPILCCRGTKSRQNIIDGLGASIGEYGFKKSEDEIGKKLKSLKDRYGPAVVTGHSLGGALAQQIAANFTNKDGLIGSVYHYNAPGVGKAVVKQFEKACAEEGVTRPKVVSVRHHRDLVYFAGGRHLPAAETIKYMNISKVTTLQAHSISHVYEEMLIKRTSTKHLSHRIFSVVVENLRTSPIALLAYHALKQLPKKERK